MFVTHWSDVDFIGYWLWMIDSPSLRYFAPLRSKQNALTTQRLCSSLIKNK